MKCLLAFLLLVFSIEMEHAAAQSDYIPIPSDAKWVYTCETTYLVPPPEYYDVVTHHNLITVGADSFIDGQMYQLLNRQVLGQGQVEVVGAIRQDIAQQKVFGYRFYTQGEILLYDFGLMPGDTLWGHSLFSPSMEPPAGLSGGGFDILDSISYFIPVKGFGFADSIIQTHNRNYYFNKLGWVNRAICAEGIGNVYFFGQPTASDGEFTWCWLTGFCTGDSSWVPWAENCDLHLSIQVPANPVSLDIYPNPSSGDVNIRMGTASVWNFRVFDTEGRSVITRQVTGDRLTLSGLATGLYMVQVSNDGQVINRSFSVVRP